MSHLFFLLLLTLLSTAQNLTIKITYPGNPSLYLRGNLFGLSWDQGIKLLKTEKNEWSYQIDVQEDHFGKLFEFKVLIDDEVWMIGSNGMVFLTGEDLVVPVFPHFYSRRGRIQYLRGVYSDGLENYRDVVVYLPPSYDENVLKRYRNVLVMHDGQNLFNASTAFAGNSWECQYTVDELVNEGKMEEIIIIGVDNTAQRLSEYTYSEDPEYGGGKGDIYLDFLEDTVIPMVRSKFRIDPSVEKYGILGSSLGGLISCYAGWTRSNLYNKAGCMSSSFWWNNQDFRKDILNLKKPTDITFYLDSGDQGDSQDGALETKAVTNKILSLDFTLNQNLFYYLDRGGSHNEISWRKRFHIPMELLYPPTPT